MGAPFDPDDALFAANFAYGRGFIIALERDTITTCDEYESMLGITGAPLVMYMPISRAAYKDQLKRGQIDGLSFIHTTPEAA